MNSSNVLIIKPVDLSVSFLDPIFKGLVNYNSIIIEPNEESYKRGVQHINEMPDSSTIMFLGHGASHCLYGAHDLSFERKPLVNNSNISIFKNKNIFSLSCRSSEFLYKNRSVMKQFIGFGNLPTDLNDIIAERDLGDPNYLLNIQEEDISFYKKTLAEIVHSSLSKSRFNMEDFEKIYLHMKLMINKEISKILIEKPIPNFRLLADIWYETKREMSFFKRDFS
jgi:hypothetical protein